MKRRDLEKRLRELGWWSTGTGSKHDKWTNGRDSIPVPRHKEINEFAAKGIIKNAIAFNKVKGEEK